MISTNELSDLLKVLHDTKTNVESAISLMSQCIEDHQIKRSANDDDEEEMDDDKMEEYASMHDEEDLKNMDDEEEYEPRIVSFDPDARTSISNELCDFLGVSQGTQMSRAQIAKGICAYIRKNNLQNPADHRTFIPDEKLALLFSILEPNKAVAYYNIQKSLCGHVHDKFGTSGSMDKIVALSNDLCDFFGLQYGQRISRMALILGITKYIHENNIRDPTNRHSFLLDEKLSKIFGMEIGNSIPFYGLQKYLRRHQPI